MGKELNKLKNKGVLVGAEDDKQSAYGPEESIAEGELQNSRHCVNNLLSQTSSQMHIEREHEKN